MLLDGFFLKKKKNLGKFKLMSNLSLRFDFFFKNGGLDWTP
jgi:hypothetical protein